MGAVTLYGWDADAKDWVKVLVNAAGKLIIDPSEIFEATPTDGETAKAAQSNWSYDHNANVNAHHIAFVAADHTAIGNAAPHHVKYTNAEAVAAVEAAGLALAALKKIIIANDGVIELGTLVGAPKLFGGNAASPYEVFIQPKEGNNMGELGIMPSGSQDVAALVLWNSSDYDNGGFLYVMVDGAIANLFPSKHGTGTPITTLQAQLILDMVAHKIINLAAPTNAGDALRKGTRLTAAELLDGTLNYVLTGQGVGADPVYAAAQGMPTDPTTISDAWKTFIMVYGI